MAGPAKNTLPQLDPLTKAEGFRLLFFSELAKRPICVENTLRRVGRLGDLVFRLSQPYPECVGIYVEHGWGKPTEFIRWDQALRIEEKRILVQPPPGDAFPPFVDQKGWILADKHLMGRTVVDMDGRRTEVVNDVHLLETRNKLFIVHVDISFNGFLRRWGLRNVKWVKDQFISWKYVQPLSVEDAVTTDQVSLSIAHDRIKALPSEDLADILEELSGDEQQALFSALDTENAADALVEAEPRAQRQIIANLRKERARAILSEMSAPQLANLFTVLPHDDVTKMLELLPADQADRIRAILSEREVTAGALMSTENVAVPKETTVGEALAALRRSERDPVSIGYIYVVTEPHKTLVGVVDLRELVLAPDAKRVEEIMSSPVVSAESDDTREDLRELFAKYHFRMIPVVDALDHMLGVIHYDDIM